MTVPHKLFEDADALEHKIYEIVRSIDIEPNSPGIEGFVWTELTLVSQKLYSNIWLQVLESEKEQP